MAIKSIAEFINQLQQIVRRKDYEIYFRGHSDKEFVLLPSIYRNKTLLENENTLFKEFILRTPSDFLNEKTALEKLVKMQHYGLPTRILDITSNPLVALYFACIGSNTPKNKKEGQVLAFKIPRKDIKYYDSDTVSIIANLAKRNMKFTVEDIRNLKLEDFNKQDQIAYLLHEIKEEKSYFQNIIDEVDIERVVAVKVKQSNSRIIKQSGAFLLFGINGNKYNAAQIPNNWIVNLSHSGIDFNVDADSKNAILDELNVLGINEATLFPELDYQAAYLRKYFS